MIAWNDRNDTRIDKYDCRSLLDRIPEGPQKTDEELEEEWNNKSHTPAAKKEREIEVGVLCCVLLHMLLVQVSTRFTVL